MRKFLKQLRKGLRTACVTAALATCWNVGQSAHAAYNSGDEVTVQFTGTISPTISDLSHVYLIYGTGSSSIYSDIRAISLGDFTITGSESFSVQGVAEYYDTTSWLIAGLYGNLSSGEYTEGVNGVTLTAPYHPIYSSRNSWDDFIYTSEAAMFAYLLDNDVTNIYGAGYKFNCWQRTGMEMDDSASLYNFSEITENGMVEIQSEIIPEPVTILLLGSGGIVVLCRRRKEE